MLQCEIEKKNGTYFITFVGRVDNNNIGIMSQTLIELQRENPEKVIFNFRDLEFINSAGIGKMLHFNKYLVRNGKTLEIVEANHEIYTILTSIRLDLIIPISQ